MLCDGSRDAWATYPKWQPLGRLTSPERAGATIGFHALDRVGEAHGIAQTARLIHLRLASSCRSISCCKEWREFGRRQGLLAKRSCPLHIHSNWCFDKCQGPAAWHLHMASPIHHPCLAARQDNARSLAQPSIGRTCPE